MKKIKFLFIIVGIILLCGCGKKGNAENVINTFTKKVNGVKSYNIVGTMEIINNEETYGYDVMVDYKYDDMYKVTLKNKTNDHEQVILKNKDGVYVVTPALNKSFKFQSEWPNNGSQSYLLKSILKDIENTSDVKVDETKDNYIITANVNYPNNSNLITEKIYFDKKNNLKELQVLNKDGIAVIKMKFDNIKYSVKFDDDNFELSSLISTNDCKGEENCSTGNLESSESNESSEESKTEESTSVLDNIVYPLYLPVDTHLSTKDIVSSDNGDRVIMTYAGAKPFMIIEETASASKEMEVTSVYGDPLLLSNAIGALSANSLEWHANNMEYYITSTYLTSEELMTIAESLNTATVVEITNGTK